MNYKVSVIIPVFNGENCLQDCIDSLINQTIGFDNIEVILIDDNSKDNSSVIIKNLANQYSNIKSVFLKSNTGTASGPRNEGLKHITSDFVMFSDMDDYYYPEMCQTMYDTITGENVDVVSCRYTRGDLNNAFKVKNNFFDKQPPVIKVNHVEEFPEIMSLGFSTMIWSKIFRKSVIYENNIEFPVGDLYEDVYFSSKFYLHADGIVLLNDFYGYCYHVRTDGDEKSFSQEFSENMFNRQFSGFKKTMDLFDGINYEYTRIKSELIIDMTKIFLFTNLNEDKQKNFLNYMKHYYKSYSITTRVGTTNILFNSFINVFIKLFAVTDAVPLVLSKLRQLL